MRTSRCIYVPVIAVVCQDGVFQICCPHHFDHGDAAFGLHLYTETRTSLTFTAKYLILYRPNHLIHAVLAYIKENIHVFPY